MAMVMGEVNCVSWLLMVKFKYPTAFKTVTAILTIFHGPCVESTFIVMGDVIDKHSGCMSNETYSCFQDIKFALKAQQPIIENRSVKKFRRENKLFTLINPTLVNKMSNACIHHNRDQNKKREIGKRKKEKFEVEVNEVATTKKLKLDNAAGLKIKSSSTRSSLMLSTVN